MLFGESVLQWMQNYADVSAISRPLWPTNEALTVLQSRLTHQPMGHPMVSGGQSEKETREA